jgi:hypothetical protein
VYSDGLTDGKSAKCLGKTGVSIIHEQARRSHALEQAAGVHRPVHTGRTETDDITFVVVQKPSEGGRFGENTDGIKARGSIDPL